MSQNEVKNHMQDFLESSGYLVVNDTGYLYAKGDLPVVVTAHMDTVHSKPVKEFHEELTKDGKHKVFSPQGIGGDDRCGIWIIKELVKANFRPTIILCEDEEAGCIGSKIFVRTPHIDELKNVKYMIELDRAHADDAVYYDCNNEDFIDYITRTVGYGEEYGSFTDISHLAPAAGVAAVNLSCGYYNPHCPDEFVILEEMEFTLEATKRLLSDTPNVEPFEYVERKRWWQQNYGWGGRYGWDYGEDDGEWCDQWRNQKTTINQKFADDAAQLYVIYIDRLTGYEEEDNIVRSSRAECWWAFFEGHSNICFDDVLDYWFY